MDIPPLAARTGASPAPPAKAPDPDSPARAAAEAFEASFIGEMLKESGINQSSASFGGGAGEEAFSSFLTEQYAAKLVRGGGFGLAEKIFEALRARGGGA
jgi:Rod binding domain-containing protein